MLWSKCNWAQTNKIQIVGGRVFCGEGGHTTADGLTSLGCDSGDAVDESGKAEWRVIVDYGEKCKA